MKTFITISLLMSLMLLSCHGGDKEVIILPKSYKGYIVLIYNQKNGVPVKFENGKRVYEIPANGILKTQFQGNYGLKEFTEYYFEKIDSKNAIPSYADFKQISSNNNVVGLIGPNGKANKDYEGKQTVEYSLYFVGTKEEILKAIEQAEKLNIASLTE